jgi:hypothetical protein
MALGSTQPLTLWDNLPGSKGRPVRKADNLTAICEPIVWKMWDLRRITNLWRPPPVTALHLQGNSITYIHTRVCIRNRGTNVLATSRSHSDVSEIVHSERKWHGDARTQHLGRYLHLNWNLNLHHQCQLLMSFLIQVDGMRTWGNRPKNYNILYGCDCQHNKNADLRVTTKTDANMYLPYLI